MNEVKTLNTPKETKYTIEASESHLKQVFFNVVHNAVKYSFEGNRSNERYIEVTCKEYGYYICIEISNYGIGIEEDELKNELIFKMGYRGKKAGDRCRIGSGLGLWIVKRIIDDHHGRIKVESKKVGEGEKIDPYLTTVKIYLPITQSYPLPQGGFFYE